MTNKWLTRFARSLAGFCTGEYRNFGLDTNIIITTLILTSKVLRWGRCGAVVIIYYLKKI